MAKKKSEENKDEATFSVLSGSEAEAEKEHNNKPKAENIPWGKFKFKNIDMRDFEDKMNQLGLNNYTSVIESRKRIFGILQGLYQVDISAITEFARQHQNK